MYSMRETCEITGLTYQTLKFYCNEGLVPNVKRNINNYRIFDDKDIAWIKGLIRLKNCNMSIKEMKEYMNLCLIGEKSIEKRKKILTKKKENLELMMIKIQDSIDYINKKQQFYDDVLNQKIKYYSNLK